MSRRAALPLVVVVAGIALFASGSAGRLIVAVAAVFFAPGYLLWSGVGANHELRLPRLAAPAVWLGLSLSLVPLVFLWATMVGLRLMPAVLRGQALGAVILGGWLAYRAGAGRRIPLWLAGWWLGILVLVAATRAMVIRGIVLPLWVDSVHHTLITQVVIETGRVPTSLEPYLEVPHLVYHWGFHALSAAVAAVAALPAPTAVLWGGQALNAALALAMYGLGATLLRSPRAGLIAAAVAGLLSLFPAYYVTWGRYTQLTGLVVLPSLLMVSLRLVERPALSWRLVALYAVLLSGLLLIHYHVFVFYATFMAVYLPLAMVRQPRRSGQMLLRLGAGGLGAALLSAPWLVVMFRQIVVPVVSAPGVMAGPADYNAVDWGLLWAGNNRLLLSLALAAAVLAVIGRRWRVVAVAGWVLLLGLVANPEIVGLQASWFVINQTVIIMLFMPAALLIASGVDQVLRWGWPRLQGRLRPVVRLGASAVALAAVLFGAWQLSDMPLPAGAWLNRYQVPVVNRVTVLATAADLPAIAWAAANTPPDARFLVNSAPWLNGSPRGTDAGWWLLPLARRWVTTPPAMYIYGDPAYKAAVEALNRRIAALQPTDAVGLEQLVRDERINYVFVGKNGGPIKPELLWGNPLFVPVYNADGVSIFEVRANA